MDRLCETCSNSQLIEKHQELLGKTKDNLLKHQRALDDKKQKKLEALNQPPPKKPRQDRQNRRRRGMNKSNNPPPPQKDASRKPRSNSPPSSNNNNNPSNNLVYVNPNHNSGPQVAALFTEMLQYLQRQPTSQATIPQTGLSHNALATLQQPSLWGPGASLGRQQPSLAGLGTYGPLPQQPQLQGVGQDFLYTGRPL